MFAAFTNGFIISFGLILAIGAQNAYVLRQGLRNEHVFIICLFCAFSDALLIVIGVLGFKELNTFLPSLGFYIRIIGALYLLIFGLKSLYAAFVSHEALVPTQSNQQSLKKVFITLALITWLNPHVYLDTILLLGVNSSNFPGFEFAFAIGASLASFIFFFTLGYGARLLRPFLTKPVFWRILEAAIGIVMLVIALSLIWSVTGL